MPTGRVKTENMLRLFSYVKIKNNVQLRIENETLEKFLKYKD